MARTAPKNTIVVEVSDFSKLSSSERTAATNWMTATAASIVANGANLKKETRFAYPDKGSKTVPAQTVVITARGFSKLASADRTLATNWLTAIIAQVVAAGATQKNKKVVIYPPKG